MQRDLRNPMEIYFVARNLQIHRATGGWTFQALSGYQQNTNVFKLERSSFDVSILTWK